MSPSLTSASSNEVPSSAPSSVIVAFSGETVSVPFSFVTLLPHAAKVPAANKMVKNFDAFFICNSPISIFDTHILTSNTLRINEQIALIALLFFGKMMNILR